MRVVTILWLLLVSCMKLYAQLGHIDGQLRYDHRYQDIEYDGNLTKILVQNPSLDLRMRGNILSPRFMAYSLFSSLSANYVSAGNAYFSYSASQYSWNRYNLILNILPYSPVKVTLAARENAYDVKSENDVSTDRSADRQQEQRAEVSVHQVSWLPTLSLSYLRTRSYSDIGYPYDIVNQTLTFTATGATDTTGSYGLTASMVDLRDRMNGVYDRFLTMQFSAVRTLSEKHGVNISTEYEQYTGYSVLSGSVMYSGVMSSKLRMNTGLSASSVVSTYSQSRTLALTQSASYVIDQNFQCGLGASGFLGNSQVTRSGEGWKDIYKSWTTSGNLQHRRSIAGVTMVNALLMGYSEQHYSSRYHSFNTALSNSVSRQLGLFSLSGNYNLSYLHVTNSTSYDVVDNSASVIVSGRLPHRIQSQSDLRYRDSRYPGEGTPFRNQRTLFFTQRFDGSFTDPIPFSAGFSTSINWFLAGLTGHTYGWSFTFTSPAFFTRGLTVSYTYSRNYDPYYQREVPEHNASLSYQWRAFSFTSRLRHTTFPLRVREVQFSITRPF
jgi:hypothetical protein